MTEDFRQEAEKHWVFVKALLEMGFTKDERTLELMRFLYVEAMVHGYKHALNGGKQT